MNQEDLTVEVKKQDPKGRSCKVKQKGARSRNLNVRTTEKRTSKGLCSFEIVDRRIMDDIKVTIPQVLEYIKDA